MSCQDKSNRIARLVCQVSSGIARLSSKQAFCAGVGLGGAGVGLGALALARRDRLARLFRGRSPVRRAQIAPGGRAARPIPRPRPKPIPRPARPRPKPIPGLAQKTAETKLTPAPVQVHSQSGPLTLPGSYQVRRADGTATGLALTPYLGPDNQPDPQTWSVTHARTGLMISGPYDSLAQAQGLAGQLAALPWTAERLPAADIKRAQRLIADYRQGPDPPSNKKGRPKSSEKKPSVSSNVTAK